MMSEKLIKGPKGFSSNGVVWPGQKGFSKDFVSIEIVDTAVKTGEGDDDFVVTQKVIETKRPIKEVVDADKDSVGVYNIIKQVLRTGDETLLPRDDGKASVDALNAPENLMELKQKAIDAEKSFNQLPKELTKGMDMKSFVDSFTNEQFDAFVKAMADRTSKKEIKKEVKENE